MDVKHTLKVETSGGEFRLPWIFSNKVPLLQYRNFGEVSQKLLRWNASQVSGTVNSRDNNSFLKSNCSSFMYTIHIHRAMLIQQQVGMAHTNSAWIIYSVAGIMFSSVFCNAIQHIVFWKTRLLSSFVSAYPSCTISCRWLQHGYKALCKLNVILCASKEVDSSLWNLMPP